jgi:hypothetical protein
LTKLWALVESLDERPWIAQRITVSMQALSGKRLRPDKGLSQDELAERAATHQAYLSGGERGVRNASRN